MKRIRTIQLELLRHGPAHNQLLSPLTRYLGLCGNHPPATVTVPFEHEHFLGRLQTLRYQDSTSTRQIQLKDIAQRMAEILATTPGLIAEFSDVQGSGGLTHLELVLSASELALLPFELAYAPDGFPAAGQPLALQKEVPLCVTRRVRRAGGRELSWRRRPRVLFVAASPPAAGTIPMEAHVQALREVIEPWVHYYDRSDREQRRAKLEPHLVLLLQASIASIEEICRREDFTHVHILAHGVPITDGADQGFGLALHDSHDPAKIDKVDGARLASALRTFQPQRGENLSAPLVVSLASCDSGQVGSVVGAGASVAHALHAAGVPLVVASQFPLSFDGSVVMVKTLYRRLLEGDDPRSILGDLRQQLKLQVPLTHDWGSLVAYAALPPDLEYQLQDLRLRQAKGSVDASLDWIGGTIARAAEVEQEYLASGEDPAERQVLDPRARRAIETAVQRLEEGKRRLERLRDDDSPERPPAIRAEIRGLLASAEKQEAQLDFHISNLLDDDGLRDYRRRSLEALRRAREHYRAGFEADPVSHWNLVQWLSLTIVLGTRADDLEDRLTFARLQCELELGRADSEAVAWAHGSLAEISMLASILGIQKRRRGRARKGTARVSRRVRRDQAQAVRHASELVRLKGRESFAVFSTRRQFLRYLDWFFIVAADRRAIEETAPVAEAVVAELS